MKKITFKLGVGLSVLVILAVSFASYYIYENKESDLIIKPSYTETSYVEAKLGAGALMKIKNPKYVAEIVNSSDIIVKGQIIEVRSETNSIKLQEGSPEKALTDKRGKSDNENITGTNYTIKVIDTLKGESLPENITLYIPYIYEDLVPVLLNDDTYVLCLTWNKDIEKYIFGHPSASFYYVDENQIIKSFYDQTSDFDDFTGKTYDKLKDKLVDEVKAAKK